MKKNTENLIILEILNSEKAITSNLIANKLHISRRNVIYKIKKISNELEKYDVKLQSYRGIGYKINCSNEQREKLLNKINSDSNINYSQECRTYYAIYLFLTYKTLHSKELESLLALSRSSLSLLIKKIKKWLEVYEIQIIKTKKEGYKIISGEKRTRLALTHLFIESYDAIKNRDVDYIDLYEQKLIAELDKYKKLSTDEIVNSITKQMCLFFNSYISENEKNIFLVSMQITLYRFVNGNSVTLPKEKVKIANDKNNAKTISKIINIVKYYSNIQIPKNEAFFIYYRFIFGCDYNLSIRNELMLNYQPLNKKMVNQLLVVLNNYVNLEKTYCNYIIDNFTKLVYHEVEYDIYKNNQTGTDYYLSELKNFAVIQTIANDLVKKVCEYYSIRYLNRLMSNTCFLINSVLIECKKPLNVYLVHDCNLLEYKYFINILNSFSSKITIKKTGIDTLSGADKCDIIISTIPLPYNEKPIIFLSKKASLSSLNKFNDILTYYYEKKNFDLLLKPELAKTFDTLFENGDI